MNKKIGVIGTGRLGGMLIRGLTGRGAVPPGLMYIFNRSPHKSLQFKELMPEINLAANARAVVAEADLIFLCVKPQDLPALLAETGAAFPAGKMIVSTLLTPSLAELDRILTGKIVRIYPSVTQSTGYGVTLMVCGKQVATAEKQELQALLECLGQTYEVPEACFRLYGDVTSCGPAFMAFMVGSLADAAVRHGGDAKLAAAMAEETMLGTAKLLQERSITFRQLVEEVATPGGCTAEGINVLRAGLSDLLDGVFQATAVQEEKLRQNIAAVLEKNQNRS
ncbi:MAG: pyrroline-5-carboxylate reductase dimerization domain-containing protein [Negativicutes bacterium]|nr:pyrroline-5-carboxylate reductase dimerization domain-containing protein [Negativicutes bacterium]